MKNLFIVFFASVLLLFSFSAWSASTKAEVIVLQEQVEAMQKDLAEIKKLLKEGARTPTKRAEKPFKKQVVSVGTSPYKGKADAIVTMIEYSDYQCPYCAKIYREVMPTLVREYIDTGKLKFVMRENPLVSIHPNAMGAAMAAMCAGEQDKYFEMHDLMFDNQRKLGIDNLKTLAGTIGMDATMFDECLDSKKYQKEISDDIASAAKLGARGTPGFVLGLTDQDDSDKANMTVLLRGARTINSIKRDIDKLIASAE